MKRFPGFTLLELMIAIAVIGILASIAYPSYRGYLTRAHRSAAQQYMLELANLQEQFLLDARAYATLGGLNTTLPDDVANFYQVAITVNNAATPPSFLITATPKAGTVQAGDSTLTLNSSGQKAPADKW